MPKDNRYAFDVEPDRTTQTFLNRRVFAYVDTTIPDGFALDERGNVYVTSGDGVVVRYMLASLLARSLPTDTSPPRAL